MNWIERKEGWLGPVGNRQPRSRFEKEYEEFYTVAEVARIFKVDRDTVYKWLSKSKDENLGIPVDGWIKLPPGTDIRIRRWAVEKLMK